MPANENQWDHIGPLAQKPDASNFNEGYTYLANDAAVGYAVAVGHRTGERYWQQIFCQCWTDITPVCSIKNISLTNQTLPPVYGSVTIPPGQSIILQDDPQWASYTLRSNGISLSNFAIGFLLQDCPLDAAVYVDGTNGSDANPGTQALPVATIRQAFRIWPNEYARTCNMFVTGTTQESTDDLIVYPPMPVGPDAKPPCIIGVMQDVGLGQMTVQSFTPSAAATTTSAGDAIIPSGSISLPFDAYAGQELRMVSGSISGRGYTLMNNDTGAFYLPHSSHSGLPAAGDKFQILKPNSTVTLSGQFSVVGGELGMYGINIAPSGSGTPVIVVNASRVYMDSVRSNVVTEVLAGGSLVPGAAHNICSIPSAPIPSNGTMGMFSGVTIAAYSGMIGDYRWLTGNGGTIPTGTVNPGVLVMRGGKLFVASAVINLFAADLLQVWVQGSSFFNILEQWRINGSPSNGLLIQGPCLAFVSEVDISGCGADGVSLDHGASLVGSSIGGSSNAGVGMRVSRKAQAAISDAHAPPSLGSTCISGTGGHVIVGSNTVDTWTNIAAGNAAHTTDWNASSTGVATSQGCRVGP